MGPTALLPLQRKSTLPIFITHKNHPPMARLEPTAGSPVGPVASMLTTRPPRAASMKFKAYKRQDISEPLQLNSQIKNVIFTYVLIHSFYLVHVIKLRQVSRIHFKFIIFFSFHFFVIATHIVSYGQACVCEKNTL
jgi:hypothetical protein